MVRSVARGQFHVTAAWDAMTLASEPTGPDSTAAAPAVTDLLPTEAPDLEAAGPEPTATAPSSADLSSLDESELEPAGLGSDDPGHLAADLVPSGPPALPATGPEAAPAEPAASDRRTVGSVTPVTAELVTTAAGPSAPDLFPSGARTIEPTRLGPTDHSWPEPAMVGDGPQLPEPMSTKAPPAETPPVEAKPAPPSEPAAEGTTALAVRRPPTIVAGPPRPGSGGRVADEGARVTSAPRPAPGTDPGQVLVGLLARMWLMRSSGTVAGGGALTAPPAPSLPARTSAPAPAPPLAAVPPAPAAAGTTVVAPQVPPAAPPLAPVESLPRELTPPRAPEVDERRPRSGLASFLVEVADVAHPPQLGPAAPAALPRVRYVFEIVHCPHPIPDRPVSRSLCHQRRFGE